MQDPMNNLPEAIRQHTMDLQQRCPHLIDALPGLIDSFHAIVQAVDLQGIFYLCGNGGSFADALHIKGELTKNFERKKGITNEQVEKRLNSNPLGAELLVNLEFGIPVVVLGEFHSLRSAFENDKVAVYSYAQELNAFASHIPNGVFMGISTSGNAKNVIAAATLAKAYEITTIGFTGPDGGQLANLVDIAWKVPGACTACIQENQIPLYHTLCRMIETYYHTQ